MSELKGDLPNIYVPSVINSPPEEDSIVPSLSFDESTGKFTGDKLPTTDCFPIVIEGISVPKDDEEPWYTGEGLCVRLQTYGGLGESGSDLCCLFHSSGKSLLPSMSHISTPFITKKQHSKDSTIMCQNFKAHIASFMLCDTHTSDNEVKLRYTLQDSGRFSEFFANVESDLILKDKSVRQDYINRCLAAIKQRQDFLAKEEQLRVQRDTEGLLGPEKEKLD